MEASRFETIMPGDSYTLEKTITEDIVKSFADFTGDLNPVHMDESYCIAHGLGSKIAHGMIGLSFLSALIGMHLPGNGSVWLSQQIDFISPVRIGDTIRITGTVTEKNNNNALGLGIVEMRIGITNQSGRKIARGNVKVHIK